MTSFMNRMVSPGGWDVGVILVWVLVVAVIVVLGALIYRLLGVGPRRTAVDQGTHGVRGDGDALGSLERRYASGEIDDEEFKRRRETIRAGRDRAA